MANIRTPKTIEKAGENEKGEWWKVTWSDDKVNTIFDVEQRDIIEEAIAQQASVEVGVKKEGKYWNIKSIKPVDIGITSPPEKTLPQKWHGKSPEERESIERQTAAKIAFEFPQAPLAECLQKAEAIYQWIANGTLPMVQSSAVTPVQPTVDKEARRTEVREWLAKNLVTTDQKRLALKKLNEYNKTDHKALSDAFMGLNPEQAKNFQDWVNPPAEIEPDDIPFP